MNIKFSIIIPVYNKAPYVRKALDSIVSQTFSDWECIIVDDGSTDGSAAICEEYLSTLYTVHHTPYTIHLLRQPNSGVAKARNVGVENSHGEYLCFLDADDWWEPTYLEEMSRLIETYPDAGLYGCDYFYVKNSKKKIYPKDTEGYIDYCKVYKHCGAMPIHPNGAIIPRKVYDEIGGFDPSIKMGEDFILFMQIVFKHKVAFLNKQLVTFNQDADPKWRAITKLHKPENHMLWHVGQWEEKEKTNASYKAMIDMLRVNSLLPYWLSDEYHDAAAAELAKVDWSMQSKSIVRQYRKPLPLLKAERRFLQICSFVKQKIKKIL